MANGFTRLLSKLVRKLGMAVLVAGLALVACALWIYGHEGVSFETRRAQLIADNQSAVARTAGEVDAVNALRQKTAVDLAAEQARAVQVEKVLTALHETEPGTLDRFFGDKTEVTTHAARLARMLALKTYTQTKIVELQRDLVLTDQQLAERSQELDKLKQAGVVLENENRPLLHYLRCAWTEGRWLVIGVFVAYLVGGFFMALMLYYGWARWVARGRPMRFNQDPTPLPMVVESAPSVESALWPGEGLWVRPKFLQSTEDGLVCSRQWLLNWRMPFSWLAVGLRGLTLLRNTRSDGERRVVFACADDPYTELLTVAVPENGSFMMRPRFLVGLVGRSERAPACRRRWKLLTWQSWISGQFAYLEFAGPCRLIVACPSELHSQLHTGQADEGGDGTRYLSQAGLVGFSPGLALKPSRSVGFWRYYRGTCPLFEVAVTGAGALISREAQGRGRDGFRALSLKCAGL